MDLINIVMTEEDDMMTEECLMREEATEGGQGHIAQGVLAELGAGHEVQETEDDQGHGVGQDLDLDLGRLVNLGQGQDLEKEKVRIIVNYLFNRSNLGIVMSKGKCHDIVHMI